MMTKKRFKHQLYDLCNLDRQTRDQIIDGEIEALVGDRDCLICGLPFVGKEDKDNAIVASLSPLGFAHESCWLKLKDGEQ